MIKINNFFDNSNVKCIAEGGVFSIYGADECKETSSTV